jgi:putative phosphoesterase
MDNEELDLRDKDIRKVLIVSDSHGVSYNLDKVINVMNDCMDLMIHAGDIITDPDIIRSKIRCPMAVVRGNCDFNTDLPLTMKIHLKGHDIFLMHGTGYYTGDKKTLTDMAAANGCDVMVVGHTHLPDVYHDRERNIYLANPGSITRPRQEPSIPTYLVMNINDDGSLEFVPVKLNY